MRRITLCTWVLAVSVLGNSWCGAEIIRVSTYNIYFLKASASPVRLDRIRQVIAGLDADIIGLQEINDRDALEAVFDIAEWQLVIDDDSDDSQDLACAVRKPLRVVGLNTTVDDLDADDDDFLYPGSAHSSFFPNRRDCLLVDIELPDSGQRLHVLVHHAKARVGGRPQTDGRREGAAIQIVQAIEQRFDGDVILTGDMNDNPDDRSMNILESGSPGAVGGPIEGDDIFLVNLTETLLLSDQVSHGTSPSQLDAMGNIDNVVSGSRAKNNENRGDDIGGFPILFDQILVSPNLQPHVVSGSCAVYRPFVAREGGNPQTVAASDHLPVYVDLQFGDTTDAPGGGPSPSVIPSADWGVRIVGLLANPIGEDAGNEWIEVRNMGSAPVDLSEWTIVDRSGHSMQLSGTISPDEVRRVELPVDALPLNNSGDDVDLYKGETLVDRVTYSPAQAGPGEVATFEAND